MSKEQETEVFISVKEAARRLAVSPWTVYQLCDKKQIRSRYIGRRRVIEPASLREYGEGLPEEQVS